MALDEARVRDIEHLGLSQSQHRGMMGALANRINRSPRETVGPSWCSGILARNGHVDMGAWDPPR